MMENLALQTFATLLYAPTPCKTTAAVIIILNYYLHPRNFPEPHEYFALITGNLVCEVGEGSCSDCGPFDLDSGRCSSGCPILSTFMFDVTAVKDVLISSLSIVLYSGNSGKKFLLKPMCREWNYPELT